MLGHRAYTEQVHWAARSATGANESFMINEHYEALGLVGGGGLGLDHEAPLKSEGIEPTPSRSTGRRAAPREPMRELYVILFNYAPPPLRPRGAHATGGGISDFRFQISDFRFQISDPNTRQTDFCGRFQISDFRSPKAQWQKYRRETEF